MRTEQILDHIVPHFHQALVRLSHSSGESLHLIVSSREREVLAWLKEGKSNWDISVILGISERTVKFHIKNIMRKLNAVNRSHAVAIAIERGIIDIE
ncbi:MAG: helix-turn-helix transcriptional regulator [Geobacter sp.]|nr:helix-turn-helix transcriptional regulator [Geobacter sp.]